MNVAVIDLGTNTFNLLIADVIDDHFEILHSAKEGVSIGMGGINKRVIAPDAFERGLTCLSNFKNKCTEFKVERINAFGTSAIRDAENSNDFITAVKEATGIEIKVITGEIEAELIYKGVSWSYDFSEPAVIMDIGGGSTEFIFADKNGISNLVSLNIGLLRIFQEFTFSDPMTKEDIATVKNWLDEKAGNYFEGKKEKILIGASGTFETFYEMVHDQDIKGEVAMIELPFERFIQVIEEIILSSEAQRDTNERIIAIRKKMAPIAAVKVQWIIEKLGVEKVFISTCSLKEGALK
jgi:exopolyphosphatase/guanosine-5'-triphosphate,3'-diphosphate pyrophosphatase